MDVYHLFTCETSIYLSDLIVSHMLYVKTQLFVTKGGSGLWHPSAVHWFSFQVSMQNHPTSLMALPHDVLWRSFTFAPSPVWGLLDRTSYERFAHKWVCMRVHDRPSRNALSQYIEILRGRVEKLEFETIFEEIEALDFLHRLGNGACPGLWNIRLEFCDALPLKQAQVLNTVLQDTMTHFALGIQFPMGGVFTTRSAAGDGLQVLLRDGVSRLHDLRFLSLTFLSCEMHDDACVGLVRALSSAQIPRLQSLVLRLTYNNIGAVGTNALAGWIVSLPELRDLEIDLRHNPCPPNEMAHTMGWAMSVLRLRKLTVRLFKSRTTLSRECRFPPFPFRHHDLEHIELDVGWDVHSVDITSWIDAIPKNIIHLALRVGYPVAVHNRDQHHDALLECVTQHWNRFSRLRSVLLDVYGRCGLTTLRGLTNVPSSSGLRKLVLQVGGSAGRGLGDVCSLISSLDSVTDWDIEMINDGMTDKTARTLAMHLSHCNASRLVLDVSYNGIRKAGWEALATAMGTMRNLHTLSFNSNNNPIGEHAPPVPHAWFGTIHTLCLGMEGCGLHFLDNLMNNHVRHTWSVYLMDNILLSDQLHSMRQRGWIVHDCDDEMSDE